jgi:hypothetical protein
MPVMVMSQKNLWLKAAESDVMTFVPAEAVKNIRSAVEQANKRMLLLWQEK